MLCLAQVSRAGEQRELSVNAEIEALEEAEPEGVITREVVHRLLLEHQQAVELLLFHRGDGGLDAAGVFGAVEMQCHSLFLK